jgi:hypothetical protein
MDPDFKKVGRSSSSPQIKIDSQPETKTAKMESFQTPEEVAATDDIQQPAQLVETPLNSTQAPDKKRDWHRKLILHWPPGKKEFTVMAVLIVLSGLGIASFITRQPSKPVAAVDVKPKAAAQPTTVASTLSGLQVDPSINQRPVTGVMIENTTQARPQAGLSQASVVFEAIAEGGITRFLALFQDTSPDNVGPIRSARPYYAQWALGFDAGYAHVGGSPQALANIKEWGVRDLDQFHNAGSYHRVSSRAAPHNVYTGIDTLNQLETSKGFNTSKFTGFTRKKEAPAKAPSVKTIDLAISGPVYNVHYDYAAASNSYNRIEGGAPHIDANTNTQISPKVVVALVMPYSLESDGYHSAYATIGNGTAYFFQDGTVVTGSWTKKDNKSQFVFTDASGKVVRLNPGQTWITAVGATNKVTYAP